MEKGSTRNEESMDILRKMLLLAATADIELEVQWIEGKQNKLADALSRFSFETIADIAPQLVSVLPAKFQLTRPSSHETSLPPQGSLISASLNEVPDTSGMAWHHRQDPHTIRPENASLFSVCFKHTNTHLPSPVSLPNSNGSATGSLI